MKEQNLQSKSFKMLESSLIHWKAYFMHPFDCFEDFQMLTALAFSILVFSDTSASVKKKNKKEL